MMLSTSGVVAVVPSLLLLLLCFLLLISGMVVVAVTMSQPQPLSLFMLRCFVVVAVIAFVVVLHCFSCFCLVQLLRLWFFIACCCY